MARAVDFYRTDDGACPVREFLDALDSGETQKIAWVLQLIEDLDRVPQKFFKKLADSKGIWEVRVRARRGIYRLFAFFASADRVVVTHGYVKKTRKTDAREIRRAEARRRDHLARDRR